MPLRGLGDVVAAVAKSVGIKQTPGCGCSKRQATLNRWVPFPKSRDKGRPPIYRGRFAGEAVISGGSACTPGTDCYCDCVRHTQGAFKNASCQAKNIPGDASSLLMCEDFEAPTLINDVNFGGGAPFYGPWYDATNYPNLANRGNNSYWTHNYANGSDGQIWPPGQPNPPTVGLRCGNGDPTWTSHCMTGAWHRTNLWQANSFAAIGVFQNADFNAEIGSISLPTGAAGGGSGAFDGVASLAQRVGPAGFPNTGGITGYRNWSQQRTVGITMAVAFPNNLLTSNITAENWKFNEWPTTPGGSAGDGIFMFGEAGSGNTHFPFYQFVFADFSLSQATRLSNCNNAVNGAQKNVGNFGCDGEGTLTYKASSAQYARSTNWPLGSWGCVRGYFQNWGLSNSAVTIWFTGPSGTEIKVIEGSNINLTGLGARQGIFGYTFDNYANANGSAGSAQTTQTTFRYEDNIHIRMGVPVPCSQIGFGTGGSPPPPPPPPPPSAPTIVITSPTTAATFLTTSTPL